MEIAQNFNKPPIKVCQATLKKVNKESFYKSLCPVCEEGMLLMERHPETGKLLNKDYCVLCGQHFEYTDAKTWELI